VIQLVEKEHVNVNHANAVNQSALHVGCLWGHADCVEALIERGADVCARNDITGATPLHMAVQSRKARSRREKLRVVRMLVAADPSVTTIPDFFDKIPADYYDQCSHQRDSMSDDQELLALITPSQRPEILTCIEECNLERLQEQLLLDNNNNHDDASKKMMHQTTTPLLYTVQSMIETCNDANSSQEEAGEKEEEDSSTTTTTEEEETSTTRRRLSVYVDMMRVLLEQGGADPNNATSSRIGPGGGGGEDSNSNPLHLICLRLRDLYKQQQQQQQQSEETDNDDDNYKDTTTAIDQYFQQAALLLVQHGATITFPTQLLLHDACRRNNLLFVEFLLNTLKVSVNTTNRQGMTPLMFAARSGRLECVQSLLQHADINVTWKDDRGKTALDSARVNHHQDIVMLLEEYCNVETK
jgi:ankyrin repeat protein